MEAEQANKQEIFINSKVIDQQITKEPEDEVKIPTSDDDEDDNEKTQESANTPKNQEVSKPKKDDSVEVELETLRKRNKDTQSFATKVNQKLGAVKAKIEGLAEELDIDEDIAASLLEILNTEGMPDSLKELTQESNHPFASIAKNITPEVLAQYLEVTEDEEHSQKIMAFDAWFANLSAKEQQETVEKLQKENTTPLRMLKKMINLGNDFLQSGYKEFVDAGGVVGYMDKMNKIMQEKNKTIDKLQQKLRKYDDGFDPPKKMFNGSGSNSGSGNPETMSAKQVALREMGYRQG